MPRRRLARLWLRCVFALYTDARQIKGAFP